MHVLESSHSVLPTSTPVAPRAGEQPADTSAVRKFAPTTGSNLADKVELGSFEARSSREGHATAQATHMSYHRSDRTSLFMKTRDGDVVRLSFRSRQNTVLDAASFETAEGAGTQVELSSRTATKLSVRVKGHLDADEVAAIQGTIEKASALADDFFGGGAQEAFRAAAELGADGSELAEVKLRLRSRERLTYSAFAIRSAARPASADPTDADEPVAPDFSPSGLGAPNPSPKGIAADIAPPEDTEEVPPAAADQVGAATEPDAVESGDGDPAPAETRGDARPDAFRAIGDFLSRLVDTFEGGDESSDLLDFSLKVRIFESTLLTVAQARAGDADRTAKDSDSVTSLVSETLEELAAKSADPVDRVA